MSMILDDILKVVSSVTLCPVDVIVSSDTSCEASTSRYLFAHYAHEETGNKTAISEKLGRSKQQVTYLLNKHIDLYSTSGMFKKLSDKVKSKMYDNCDVRG